MTTQRLLAAILLIAVLTGAVLTQSRTPPARPVYRPGSTVPPNMQAPPVEEYAPTKSYINPPTKPGQAPFCDAVQVGNTVYLSGRLGIDPRSGQVPADFRTEVRIAMEGIRGTLAEAGMTMDDLVSVQVFLTDLAAYDQFNAVYRTYFTRAVPARTIIGAHKLLRGARVEVQAMAVRTQ